MSNKKTTNIYKKKQPYLIVTNSTNSSKSYFTTIRCLKAPNHRLEKNKVGGN